MLPSTLWWVVIKSEQTTRKQTGTRDRFPTTSLSQPGSSFGVSSDYITFTCLLLLIYRHYLVLSFYGLELEIDPSMFLCNFEGYAFLDALVAMMD